MALFVGNDTFVKLAAAELPAGQIMALRGAFVVAIMLAAVFVAGYGRDLRRLREPAVLMRSALEAAVAFVFITALARMGLAELTAIFLTAPLIMTAASAIVLKEEVGWRRWAAVVVGFFGMVLIVRPSPAGIDWYAVLGVLSAAGAVARDLITRKVDPSTPSLVVSLATGASVAIAGLPLSLAAPWTAPATITWLYLIGAAAFVAVGNYTIIVAFRVGEVSAISPFRYTVMLWALIASVVVWGELPDAMAMIGITIIVASGLYVIHRERIRTRELRARTAGITKA
jgi:drug/metabolite transporter (DMT)-like permease